MSKPVDPVKLKFVEAKVQGASNSEAALAAKPDLSPASAGNTGMRLSRDVEVQALLNEKLKDHNITIDRALAPIDKGLGATVKRTVGEVRDDNGDGSVSVTYIIEAEDNIPLQMQASDRALKLLGVTDRSKTNPPPEGPDLAPELAAAIQRGDVSELQRIIFKQPSDDHPVQLIDEGTKTPVESKKVESHNISSKG